MNTASALPCPSPGTLLALDAGEVPEPELTALVEHLGGCPACRAALDRLAAGTGVDPLIHNLRRFAAAPPRPHTLSVEPSGSEANTLGAPPKPDTGTVADDSPPPADRSTGSWGGMFGPYALHEVLGEGGMGVVYLATDTRLKRQVALKTIKPGKAGGEATARFLAEAEAVARLQHPNVVQIFEVGEFGGHPYCALEFVPGGSLDRKTEGELLDPKLAAKLMVPVCRAVQAAHAMNLVHRDLKPGNVLLAGGDGPAAGWVPKVSDFGLAKRLDAGGSGRTQAGTVVGTPSYMAPEQAAGERVGPPADVYALGATLYDLLCGGPPFRGASVHETIAMVLYQEPVPPRELRAAVPRDLETIAMKCLEKQQPRRYATAGAVADELERFLDGRPIHARPVGAAGRAWRWCRRQPLMAALTAAVVLLAVGLLGGAFHFIYAVGEATSLKEIEARKRREENELRRDREYDAHITAARNLISDRDAGWSRATMQKLEAAALASSRNFNPVEVRTTAVACLGRPNLREVGRRAKGFDARVLAFHPNGKWLVLAQGRADVFVLPMAIRVIDWRTGADVKQVLIPPHAVGSRSDFKPDMTEKMGVSPDGRWVVVTTRSGAMHRWDLQAEKSAVTTWHVADRAKTEQECSALAFAADSSCLYVTTQAHQLDETILTRWELPTWRETARQSAAGAGAGLAAHPLGRAVYTNGPNGSVHERDGTTLDFKQAFFDGATTGPLATAPNTLMLAAVNRERVRLIDLAEGQAAYEFRLPHQDFADREPLDQVRFSPDGALAVTCTGEETRRVVLWQVATGRPVAEWRGEGYAVPEFDPTGRYLAVGGNKETLILEVADDSGVYETRALHPHPLAAAVFHPSATGRSRQSLASIMVRDYWASNARISLWHKEDFRPEWVTDPFGRGDMTTDLGVAAGPDGVTAGYAGDRYVLFDRAKNTVDQLDTGRHPAGGGFDPERRFWLTDGAFVRYTPVWTKDPFPAWENPPLQAKMVGVGTMSCLTAGWRFVLAGGRDGDARVFATPPPPGPTIPPPTTFTVESRVELSAAALSPNDGLAVVGADNGFATLVDLPSRPLARWAAHRNRVTAAVFLNQQVAATGGKDSAIRFWRLNGNDPPAELFTVRTDAPVRTLSLSPDGSHLAAVCDRERGVHVWNLPALEERFRSVNAGLNGALSPGGPP